MRIRPLLPVLGCVLALSLASAAHAAHFDLIHVQTFDLSLPAGGTGINPAGSDFAILVNKGASDIEEAEFFSAAFTVQSSRPEFDLALLMNDPGFPVVAPVHPNEAVGSTGAYNNTAVLLPELQLGEQYRNTSPGQVFALILFRNSGSYEGPVQFDVSLVMGGEEVQFSMLADVHVGDHDIQYTSAARTSSVPLPVPVARTSWGAVKSLYR